MMTMGGFMMLTDHLKELFLILKDVVEKQLVIGLGMNLRDIKMRGSAKSVMDIG